MSPKLPVAKPWKVIRALKKVGFVVHHQKGSHVFLYHPTKYSSRYVIVPYHNKDLRPGTMRDIIKHPAIDPEEFIKLL